MGILGWIIFPAVSPDLNADPLGAGVTRVVLLLIGLIWLFVLSMIIVRQEEGDLRWATVKRRLRLVMAVGDPVSDRDYRVGTCPEILRRWPVGLALSLLCRALRDMASARFLNRKKSWTGWWARGGSLPCLS